MVESDSVNLPLCRKLIRPHNPQYRQDCSTISLGVILATDGTCFWPLKRLAEYEKHCTPTILLRTVVTLGVSGKSQDLSRPGPCGPDVHERSHRAEIGRETG